MSPQEGTPKIDDAIQKKALKFLELTIDYLEKKSFDTETSENWEKPEMSESTETSENTETTEDAENQDYVEWLKRVLTVTPNPDEWGPMLRLLEPVLKPPVQR